MSAEEDSKQFMFMSAAAVYAKLRSASYKIFHELSIVDSKLNAMAMYEIGNELMKYNSAPSEDELNELMRKVMLRIIKND